MEGFLLPPAFIAELHIQHTNKVNSHCLQSEKQPQIDSPALCGTSVVSTSTIHKIAMLID
jgi:hypothetical protein